MNENRFLAPSPKKKTGASIRQPGGGHGSIQATGPAPKQVKDLDDNQQHSINKSGYFFSGDGANSKKFFAPVSPPAPRQGEQRRAFAPPQQQQQPSRGRSELLQQDLEKINQGPQIDTSGFKDNAAKARAHSQRVQHWQQSAELLSRLAGVDMQEVEPHSRLAEGSAWNDGYWYYDDYLPDYLARDDFSW